MMRKIITSVLVLLLLTGIGLAVWEPLTAAQKAPPPTGAYQARIVRDDFGVPHIFGKRDADVAFGIAYAHAEDDFATLQQVVAMTRGRTAALDGSESAPIDYMRALIDVEGTVGRRYNQLPADVRALLDGYASGLNRFAQEHPDEVRLSRLFPVDGRDIAAGFVLRSPFFFGLSNPVEDLVGNTPLRKEGGPKLSGDKGALTPVGTDPDANGSNAYAFAPARTVDGATWLISNSHQPLRGGVAWYELVVHSEEGWDFAGATFPGSPYPFLGHNKTLGWTNTVNRPDLIDIYRLELNEAGDQYRFDGKWLPLASKRIWLRIKFGPFTIPYPQTVYKSVHGPVIVNDSGAFAIRYAGIDQLDMLTQYYRINKARNFTEWRAAMAGQGVPATNFVYADKDGNIGLFYNAMFPDRAPGFDWRGVLPGDTSKALWRDELPFARVPQLINPASGYVMNANNTPWVAAGPGDELARADYSPLLGVEDDMTNRASQSIAILESFGPKISEADMMRLKYDTSYGRSGYAKIWLDRIAAVQSDDAQVKAAQKLLAAWDWNLDGKGQGDALALIVLRPANGAHYGRKAWPDAKEELTKAAAHLQEHFASLDPPLGDELRLRQGKVDLPLDGGNDTIKASTLWDVDDDGRLSLRHGDSFIMFVRWGKDGQLSSRSIQPFGSATTRPDSPHYTDQMALYAGKRLKNVWFDPAVLERHKKSDKMVRSGG